MNMRKKEEYLLSAVAPKTEEIEVVESTETPKETRRSKSRRLAYINSRLATFGSENAIPRLFTIRF